MVITEPSLVSCLGQVMSCDCPSSAIIRNTEIVRSNIFIVLYDIENNGHHNDDRSNLIFIVYLPAPASCIFLITSSRLNEPGFCLGGKSLNDIKNFPTIACVGTYINP